jgi:hypothetical protein
MAKFGEGHFQAWVREGFKEAAQALEAFPGQGIHRVEEPGLVGNPTQPMISDSMGYEGMLNKYAAQAPQQEQSRDQGLDR